jgi:pantoate--beta-alanine ligase
LPVEIVGQPTLREADGLAMSSRNAYLSPPDRERAVAIYKGLSAARDRWATGERGAATLCAEARSLIEKQVDRVDYLEIRDAQTLQPIAHLAGPAVILAAVFVGTTRLIDNMRLG